MAFHPPAKPKFDIVWSLESEHYDLKGLISENARDTFPASHFLNYTEYASRLFLVGLGRNIAMTKQAKAIAAPGFGFIDEFNVGGAQSTPRELISLDLYQQGDEWQANDSNVERVRGLAIPLCHYGLGTFGHFILDALLQVFVFRDLLSSGAAQLVHWPLPAEWMAPALEACGIPKQRRREVSKPVILMERAGLSSALAGHGVYFPQSLSLDFFQWLRVLFAAPQSTGKRRLYVRRAKQFGREITNDEALEDLVRSHGFEVVCPETYPVADQMRLFAEAGVVLSAWGSGLTLAPLLGGPRRVIELLPSSVTDAWFFRQAAVHKLDYHPIVEPADRDGNISVDIAKLDKELQLFSLL